MSGPLTIKLGDIAGRRSNVLSLIAAEAPDDTVIVHGGGREVGAWSRRLGLAERFHDGLRVTDPATLDVAVAVLAGLVNTRLVAHLAHAGRPAAGLTGADGGLLGLVVADPALGRVGTVAGVEMAAIEAAIAGGLLPVVASIGAIGGSLYNVNADEAAGAIAAARGGRLLLCTDVPAVVRDGHRVDRLDAAEAWQMLGDGQASSGMRPKLRAAIAAADAGCEVQIIDGRSPTRVRAALNGQPAGTTVVAVAAGGRRKAS
jgi:acetylglutamate kinase